jgi:CRISPR-associated protein Cas4
MDDVISISTLNDFIFCPASIYFHQLYGEIDTMMYQSEAQINGTFAHDSVDNGRYSSKADILQGISIYSERYNLIGKIDIFNCSTGVLTERKKKIVNIYDGYVFQLYAQYFCLIELGYNVKKLQLYSKDDNKVYPIDIPEKNDVMFQKFKEVINNIINFQIEDFVQDNINKCGRCIYAPVCDRVKIC